MGNFEKKLQKDNLTLGQLKTDEVARPELFAIIDNQAVYIQQLDEFVTAKKITRKQAEKIVKSYTNHQDELFMVFKESLRLTQNFQSQLSDLESKAVTELVLASFDELKSKYKIQKVRKYLEKIVENIF